MNNKMININDCNETRDSNFDDFESETRNVVMDFMGLVPLSCPLVTRSFEPFKEPEDQVDSTVSAISNREGNPLKIKPIDKRNNSMINKINIYNRSGLNVNNNENIALYDERKKSKMCTIIRKNDKLIVLEEVKEMKSDDICKEAKVKDEIKPKVSRLKKLKDRVKKLNLSFSLPRLHKTRLISENFDKSQIKVRDNINRVNFVQKHLKNEFLTETFIAKPNKSLSDYTISNNRKLSDYHTNNSSLASSNSNNNMEGEDVYDGKNILDGSSVDSMETDTDILRDKTSISNIDADSLVSNRGTLYVDVNNVDALDSFVDKGQISPVAVPLKKELIDLRSSNPDIDNLLTSTEQQITEREQQSHSTPPSPQSQVADTLRAIADQVQAEYSKELTQAVNKLVTYENCKKLTFESLRDVSMEIIRDVTPGWPQVVVPLVLGQSAAMSLLLLGNRNVVGRLVEYTTRFLCDNMNNFVAESGGWQSVKEVGINEYPILLEDNSADQQEQQQ